MSRNINSTNWLSAKLSNSIRLIVLAVIAMTNLYSAAFANALVTCVDSDGHIVIELAHDEPCFHDERQAVPVLTITELSDQAFVHASGNSKACTDWMTSSSTLSQRDVTAEEISPVIAHVKLQVTDRIGRNWTTAGQNFAFLESAPPYPVLDVLNTVILRR